jgi:hypothetical protein
MKIQEVLLEMYTAYVLDDQSRQQLAQRFPPKYDNFIGHHITVEFGVPTGVPIPDDASVAVVGYADSRDGLEALVVSVNGQKRRPDGKLYHITWSIDSQSEYKPVDSNRLLSNNRYTLVRPIEIATVPKLLK